jgi:Flp pilus assembly protein TadD
MVIFSALAFTMPLFLIDPLKAIALDPHNSDIYCLRANFHKSQRKLDLAQADFLHLKELVPSSAQTYGDLGMIFLKPGNFDSAKTHLLTA